MVGWLAGWLAGWLVGWLVGSQRTLAKPGPRFPRSWEEKTTLPRAPPCLGRSLAGNQTQQRHCGRLGQPKGAQVRKRKESKASPGHGRPGRSQSSKQRKAKKDSLGHTHGPRQEAHAKKGPIGVEKKDLVKGSRHESAGTIVIVRRLLTGMPETTI